MPYFPEAKTPQQALDIFNNQTFQVLQFRVKWKDIFDVKQFYTTLHEWLDEYGWTSHENKPIGENYETLYFEKVGAQNDKELWIRWRLWKFPDGVKNSYYRYHVDLDYHFLYLLKTEVMHEGKKFKKNIFKGEVEVYITAYIQFDYNNEWSSHPVLKFFNKVFPKRIFKKDLYEEKKRELYRECYVFQNYIKHWFKLKSFLPHEEIKPFHPSYAFPTYKK